VGGGGTTLSISVGDKMLSAMSPLPSRVSVIAFKLCTPPGRSGLWQTRFTGRWAAGEASGSDVGEPGPCLPLAKGGGVLEFAAATHAALGFRVSTLLQRRTRLVWGLGLGLGLAHAARHRLVVHDITTRHGRSYIGGIFLQIAPRSPTACTSKRSGAATPCLPQKLTWRCAARRSGRAAGRCRSSVTSVFWISLL